MDTTVKNQLWRLVKSLTKAEKRNFKLFSTRAAATTDSKFIQLFDLYARAEVLDDAAVMKRLKIKSGAYSNLKRHLYGQILTSLRLIYINKEIDIELREQIDFSHILYGKGLVLDALRCLERAKARAVEHNRDLIHLEILEFQKLIEARHITLSRQVADKMDRLVNESAERSYSVLNTSELFNQNIQIHGRYIESGHSRTEKEHTANAAFWKSIQTPSVSIASLRETFHQSVNRFHADMWYAYIQLSFFDARESALNALTRFRLDAPMTLKDPDLYLRCLYYVVMFSYLADDQPSMARYTRDLSNFLTDNNDQLNENSRLIGQTYLGFCQINDRFAIHDWVGAHAFTRERLAAYTAGTFRPNDHRWGLYLYKAAAAAFMLGRYDEATDHLNDIINMKSGILREDLLINTRLLHILCNLELGNNMLVDYHLTNLARLLRRSTDDARLHHLAVTSLRKYLKALPAERDAILADLRTEIDALTEDAYERKALRYLDLRVWLDQRLAGRAGRPQTTRGKLNFPVAGQPLRNS